jgi:hypothetical protein
MLFRRLRIIAAEDSELLMSSYSEDMRNIESLLPLLFKRICVILTTVDICSFPFLFVYKRHVSYVRRQRPFERKLVSHLECLSRLSAFLFFVSSITFPFPFLKSYSLCIKALKLVSYFFPSIISSKNVY